MLWTILRDAARSVHGQRNVHVRCECGTERIVGYDNLRRGRSISCGCLKRLHGHARGDNGRPTPTYISWQAMRTRCNNPLATDYPQYGARGITVDPVWDSFERFLSDMGERPPEMTLDRIDVDDIYRPGNCRWATTVQQRHNQRPHKRGVKCV